MDWRTVARHAGGLLALLPVAAICLLLGIAGIEAATGRDADVDRDLRVSGISALACGAFGGMFGLIGVSRTLLVYDIGARGRFTGLIAVAAGAMVGEIGFCLGLPRSTSRSCDRETSCVRSRGTDLDRAASGATPDPAGRPVDLATTVARGRLGGRGDGGRRAEGMGLATGTAGRSASMTHAQVRSRAGEAAGRASRPRRGRDNAAGTTRHGHGGGVMQHPGRWRIGLAAPLMLWMAAEARSADDKASPPPARPIEWQAARSADTLSLSGTIPSAEARDAIRAKAGALFPRLKIADTTSVAPGAPGGGFVDMADHVLDTLSGSMAAAPPCTTIR